VTAAETFFAICPRGLEALLADELTTCGATGCVAEPGGVTFSGNADAAYATNLHSRLASRILWRVARAGYADEDDVYAAAYAVAWETWFGADALLRVDLTATRTPLRSREFATLRIKDGIVDRLRDKTGARPSIDRARPDVRVFAHLGAERLDLYLDLSGEPLFKRGWRSDKGEAPLKEHLAAGLLALAGWTPQVPLFDPFCGSGTIAIEAASICAHRAPGLERRFGFERLRTFDAARWKLLVEKARADVDPAAAGLIAGCDISTQVVEVARGNSRLAGFDAWLADDRLRLFAADARSVAPPAAGGLIVANPPYGVQSNPKSATVSRLMSDVAANFKRNFDGWSAWLLSADLDLPHQMRLKESRRSVLYNGPLECRFFRFELVAGGYRKERAKPAGNAPSGG
jgi:putative N6-adenine-specific DNA methylase